MPKPRADSIVRPRARPRGRPDNTREIVTRLATAYPGATTELHYRTPFELLVATILSAQSTDARVNLVTPVLFERYPDAPALAAAPLPEIEHLIQATGFFRMKARAITGMAAALVAEHRGEVPASMEALVALPGVGRKTANVVLGHALGVPGLPVDRHVLRVAARLGIAKGTTPERVEQELTVRLPPSMWTLASDCLILHGRRVCRPRPFCGRCMVSQHCAFFRRTGGLVSTPAARPRGRRMPLAASADAAPRKAAGGRPRGPRRPTDAKALMTRARFERLVEEALRTIPQRFRRAMANVAVIVEDEPSDDILDEMEIEPPDTLFGLYQGTPLSERPWAHGNTEPDRISIYQRPIEDACEDDDEIVVTIGETVIHEFGHYFGLSEEEIEAIEERYWRGEPDEDDEEA